MNFHPTNKALEDLKNIAIYTEENWGIGQRDLYPEKIDEAFHLVAKSPRKGKNCDYIRFGYFKYQVGKHLIFYRRFSEREIQIVRILHVSMDFEARF